MERARRCWRWLALPVALGLLLSWPWPAPQAVSAQEQPPPSIARQADRASVLAHYDAEAMEALRAGEILTRWIQEDDAPGRTLRATMLVEARPERAWRILTDYARWPEIVPNLQSLEVLEEEDPVRLRHHVRVIGMDIRYGTTRTLDPARGHIEARLDPTQENDLEANRTRWQLVPLDGGASTLVEVRARVRTGWMIPGFVEDMLLDGSLPRQLRSFREAMQGAGGQAARESRARGFAAVACGRAPTERCRASASPPSPARGRG